MSDRPQPDFFSRLKERKLFQWGLAYLGGAWFALQLLDVLAGIFPIPVPILQGITILLSFGFFVALVVAWYHGESGRQRTTGPELLIVALLMILAGTVLWWVRSGGDETGSAARPPDPAPALVDESGGRSIAVLPFVDMSASEDQAYFADGMTEELTISLSAVDALQVAARTSAFAFKDSVLSAQEIGRRLGVSAVLEGTSRVTQDRLRVTAQLVDVADGFPHWSERYDRPASDVLAVQEEIALAIVSALRIELGRSDTAAVKSRTRSPEAQEAHWRGRLAWNQRTRESLEEAVGHFETAIALDSTYARAYAGLGDSFAVLAFYDYRPPQEAFPQAQAAAQQALALDPDLAEPHATLGYVALYHDWDWEAAERFLSRSIQLDPRYATAHQWYGNYLTAMGRFDEALQAMRTATELNPLSVIAVAATGWVDLYAGEYERALRQLAVARERDPGMDVALVWSGQAYESLGQLETAERVLRDAVELSGGSAISRTALARVLAKRGRAAEARAILQDLEDGPAGGYAPSYELARAYVGLGDLDRAATLLERAFVEKSHSMAFLDVDPELAELRGNPVYERLREQLGFAGPP